jgi:hypothetical protein
MKTLASNHVTCFLCGLPYATIELDFPCVVRAEPIYKAVVSWMNRTRVEVGSNTSTVALRVVGGDEKGSLESETVKYGHESEGTRIQK